MPGRPALRASRATVLVIAVMAIACSPAPPTPAATATGESSSPSLAPIAEPTFVIAFEGRVARPVEMAVGLMLAAPVSADEVAASIGDGP
ncbi:MAG: hypothetical protein A2V85_03425 [Chloroflexi bacterium RBG_16_72_14]|nr:MAG: hypothetical protein A2V85_03425 [Chloroflexi bacterium RBG_16_72_14]